MSDWQHGYCDGLAFCEGNKYQMRKGKALKNPDYLAGWDAACEDYMIDRKRDRAA